jgi:hypothetical protein
MKVQIEGHSEKMNIWFPCASRVCVFFDRPNRPSKPDETNLLFATT